MAHLFTNNAQSTLLADITNVATSLAVQSGKGALFPAPVAPNYFLVTLDDGTNIEIMKCTSRSTDTLTVTRAQEGTTGFAFVAGAKVELRLTAAEAQNMQDAYYSSEGTDSFPFTEVHTNPLVYQYPLKNVPKQYKTTSLATLTPSPHLIELYILTAQAAAITIANPTNANGLHNGTPLRIRIKDNATARAITFGTQYRAMGTALPTTTVLSKTLYLTFIYNLTDTKWDLIHSAQEA